MPYNALINTGAAAEAIRGACIDRVTEYLSNWTCRCASPTIAEQEIVKVEGKTIMSLHFDDITEREYQILTLLARGLRNQNIAVELSISEATVENHLHHIFEKLGVSNRVQAALCHVRGIIPTRRKDEGNPS